MEIGAVLLVATGSALGGVARYGLDRAWPFDPAVNELPVATLVANLVGSFLIGVLFGASTGGGPLEQAAGARLLLGVGLLGGFTTFSAFSQQTLAMLMHGEPYLAVANVALSVVGGLVAAALGFAIAQVV
jgi:fluoride exporter